MRPLTIAELISHLQDLVDNCGCAPYDPVYFNSNTFNTVDSDSARPIRGVYAGPALNRDLDSRSILLTSEPR